MSGPDDDDQIAGEYVLGTLDAQERAAAAARRDADPGFDRAIGAWEDRLAPLVETVPEVEPSAHIWPSIVARIASLNGGSQPSPVRYDERVVILARQVSRWRRMAVLTTALAAAMALWIAIGSIGGPGRQAPQMIAVLMKSGDEAAYLMSVSLRDDTVAVRPVAARTPEGKSYELWVIDPAIGPPRSLGTIDPATPVHRIPAGIARDVVARATYAVTLEPVGGSPNGAPSGAPVFVGHAIDAP